MSPTMLDTASSLTIKRASASFLGLFEHPSKELVNIGKMTSFKFATKASASFAVCSSSASFFEAALNLALKSDKKNSKIALFCSGL